MANKRFRPALAISTLLMMVLGMAFLGACASAKYTVMQEPPKPDNRSAVVYIYGSSSTKAEVWDGEKPVGTFDGGPWSAIGCMPWRATPGSHTFVAKSSNTVHTTMNLQANRSYYIEVHTVPSPPFTTLIIMRELNQDQETAFRKRYKIKNMSFSDEWRKDFLAYQNGKRLKEVQAYLQKIKNS